MSTCPLSCPLWRGAGNPCAFYAEAEEPGEEGACTVLEALLSVAELGDLGALVRELLERYTEQAQAEEQPGEQPPTFVPHVR